MGGFCRECCAVGWATQVQSCNDSGLIELSYKLSWLFGYMRCITNHERCWSFSSWYPWLSPSHVEYYSPYSAAVFQEVSYNQWWRTSACKLIEWLLEDYILSGTYNCFYSGYSPHLTADIWILRTVWEVLALCLTCWVAVQHFRELPRTPGGPAIEDCISVLTKNHIFYFAGWTNSNAAIFLADIYRMLDSLQLLVLSLANHCLQRSRCADLKLFWPFLMISWI